MERGLIVVLWRAALRIREAIELTELDLVSRRGSILVRRGKGGRRREVGIDDWASRNWSHGSTPLDVRRADALRDHRPHPRARVAAGVRRRFAPHELRHADAIELADEGVPLNVIQRQLEHRNLGVTSIYLLGADIGEIIDTVHGRRPPTILASAVLHLPHAS
jgi:site-specific recombinase XerD